MKNALTHLALLAMLAMAACSSGGGSALNNFNPPAVHEGPGCYDHKGRIERTITTPVECKAQDWVWRPS